MRAVGDGHASGQPGARRNVHVIAEATVVLDERARVHRDVDAEYRGGIHHGACHDRRAGADDG